MAENWFINVQINTQFIETFNGSGSWNEPIGAKSSWGKHALMTAVGENKKKIYNGTGDNFELKVHPEDTLHWFVSEVNPLRSTHRRVCMYGFKHYSNWDKHLTRPHLSSQRASHVEMTRGFDGDTEPSSEYLKLHLAGISVPHAKVKTEAQGGSVRYYIRLLLLDTEDYRNPKVLKYAQVDPTINIVL